MAANIVSELTSTGENFLAALNQFNPDNFNAIPFEGSWTAGQVAEHVFKSVNHTPELLGGDSKPTDRDPNQNTQGIRDMFLNFETKMKSPDFILPSDEPKDLASLTEKLGDRLTAIIEAAKTIDVDLTIVGFEFPGSGPMTRIELLNFLSVHTQRHTHQLNKIAEQL